MIEKRNDTKNRNKNMSDADRERRKVIIIKQQIY